MSDRGFLFLFSVLMIVAGVATVAYLVATGQAGTVDGLFLTLTGSIARRGLFCDVPDLLDQPRDGSG